MKKTIGVFTIIMMIVALFPFHTTAWVPDKTFYCQVDTVAIPKNSVYIDLLMPIPTDNEAYTEINQTNADIYGFSNDSEIIKYNKDGFVSYTFHIVDASSDLTISADMNFNERGAKYDFEYCRKNFKEIKFAYLDADGNIISVSNSVKINTLRVAQFGLKLSGNNLTKDVTHGPPVYLIVVIPVMVLITAFALTTTIIIIIVKRVKKKT